MNILYHFLKEKNINFVNVSSKTSLGTFKRPKMALNLKICKN